MGILKFFKEISNKVFHFVQVLHNIAKFGKDRVLKELNYKFKAMFEFGFIDVKGLIIPLTGDYKEYGTFKELLEMINE